MTNMTKAKRWYKSKGMYFGIALIAIGFVEDNMPFLKSLIGEDDYGRAVALVGAIATILRVITKEPIKR